ncbi:DUF885 family protein [Maribacter antarcticus]|uniref:DUF885 family protein n=1 Tax=Maribacter antarcticus TaxID=505250 RepID=UPI00047A2365|nr:DUF885 family protein [Maribacter antarcticus]
MRYSIKAFQLILIGLLLYSCSPQEETGTHKSSVKTTNDYNDLVSFFEELRDFQIAPLNEGVPDYSKAAMDQKSLNLSDYQTKLYAIDTTGWSVSEKIDYYLVWAEMNAVEFHLTKYKPWATDPGFYSFRLTDAGSSMNLDGIMPPLFRYKLPLTDDEVSEFRGSLKLVPKIMQQARVNLTHSAADFADFAIKNMAAEATRFERMAEDLQEYHPELVSVAQAAAQAMKDYQQWIVDNKATMTGQAGSGKENYSWWMHNVQLSPWGWEENNFIIQREYDRAITFLKLEEQRNRKLPPLEVAMTERAYEKSLRQALHYVVKFLDENEIMTIDDWINPADYYSDDSESVPALSELSDEADEKFFPENSNVDLKYRQREILPGENHEYVGHMLDYQRQSQLDLSYIRRAERKFNMGSMRLEGWAVWMEECLMQAGILDERPHKGREMVYLMYTSHMSLSIPDMKMHANEIDLAEARKLCAEIMPRGWTQEEEDVVWFEMQSNLRNPGGFHSNVVTGKAYFMKLFKEYAVLKGDDFVIKDFMDEFLSYGIIPMPLIRWGMTGNSDELNKIKELYK